MRLNRFYIPEPVGTKKEIILSSNAQVDQIRRVFRLKTDDKVIVFDGSGSDYECRIADMGKSSTTLAITSVSRSRYLPLHDLYLCAAVVKKDTFEWIAEKATELGVTEIVPVMAERSEKKNLNLGRLEKIVVEASEQSGRGTIPQIKGIMDLNEIITYLKSKNVQMAAFHTEGQEISNSGHEFNRDNWAIFIGPEGGWSEGELNLLRNQKVAVYSLGPQVLRAETAVVAALSLLQFANQINS